MHRGAEISAGIDGDALWVNNLPGLTGEDRLGKIKMARIGRWVVDPYDKQGRITNISDEELTVQEKKHLPLQYEDAEKSGRFTAV